LKPLAPPNGPHEREQQDTSQLVPVAAAVPGWQTVPVGEQPLAPPPWGSPHTPVAAPAAFVQLPEQHSDAAAQMSPFCVQNETASEQRPALQKLEQQSVGLAQGLPEVRQLAPGLTEPHTPPPVPSGLQIPLQHWSFRKQTPAVGLSGTHCWLEQLPATQEPVQHSVPAAHVDPGRRHEPVGGSQVPAVPPSVAQFAEQQSPLAVHPWPTSLHSPASMSPSRVMASMNAPSPGPPSTLDASGPPSPVSSTGDSLPHAANRVAVETTPSSESTTQGSFLIAILLAGDRPRRVRRDGRDPLGVR